MKIIGLTGRTGSGKSTVCDIFRQFGIPCLDADLVSRQVVEKGTPCLFELTEYFGSEILLEDGSLDRKKLGNIAFSDEQKLNALNSITHKHINQKVLEWISEMKKSGADAVVIDAPTLFESGEDKICDTTVAVISDDKKRIDRIIFRDNITHEYANKRISAQKDDKFFAEHCQHIIYNNKSISDIKKETEQFLKKLCILKED